METLGKIIFSIGLAVSGFFGFQQPDSTTQLGSTFTPVQASQFTLSGAGITSSATTIQLTSFKLPDPDRTPITMAMFGDIGYAVIEPQTNKIENITFTGVTQNANGTALLTGVTRGINFVSPYTGSSVRALSHAGGSYLILSNPAAFYGQQFLFANSVSTSTAPIWFGSTTPPRYENIGAQASGTYNATTSEFASIVYVDSTVLAGCATASAAATGCVRLGTQLQSASSTFSAGTPTVLTTQFSTSSPFMAGLWSVITRNDGKISPLFIATSSTDVYNWGGITNFLASTTFQATTTIAASNALSRAVIFNNIPYAFPSFQGASSSVMQNNGSGTLVSMPVSRLIATGSPVANYNSNSASTTRFIATVPGNNLGAENIIKITDYVSEATESTGNALIYELGYGTASTTFVMTNAGADASICVAPGGVNGRFEIILGGNGTAGSQLVTARFTCDSAYSTVFTPTLSWSATMSQDSTTNKQLMLVVRTRGAGVNDRYGSNRLYAEFLAK